MADFQLLNLIKTFIVAFFGMICKPGGGKCSLFIHTRTGTSIMQCFVWCLTHLYVLYYLAECLRVVTCRCSAWALSIFYSTTNIRIYSYIMRKISLPGFSFCSSFSFDIQHENVRLEICVCTFACFRHFWFFIPKRNHVLPNKTVFLFLFFLLGWFGLFYVVALILSSLEKCKAKTRSNSFADIFVAFGIARDEFSSTLFHLCISFVRACWLASFTFQPRGTIIGIGHRTGIFFLLHWFVLPIFK